MQTSTRIIAGLTALALAAGSGLAGAQPRGPDHGPDRGADRGPDRGPERGPDRAPPGHAYGHDRGRPDVRRDVRHDDHAYYRGGRLPPEYRGRQYVVDDWRGHRLSAPPRGYHWVQAGGDYVLVAIATGIIASVLLANH